MLSNNLYLEANCELRSLIGAPSAVGGRVYIDDDNALSKRAINDYLAYLKHPTPEHTDDTGHYLP